MRDSLDDQPDLSPKWRPRYLRLGQSLPITPTNKVLTRTLVQEKFRSDLVGGDDIYVRSRGDRAYRVFTAQDEGALREAFTASGRIRLWDL